MEKYKTIVLLLACSLWSSSAYPDNWAGQVVLVQDGDTLTVLRNNKSIKVRLNEIDAPELKQAYGIESKQSLSSLCFGRQAEIKEQGRDIYHRVLARVSCNGVEANTEQVRRGYAWFYEYYSHDTSLRQHEISAREKRIGLWADTHPIPPWEFRRTQKKNVQRSSLPNGIKQDSWLSDFFAFFSSSTCGSKRYCSEMRDCKEARYYLEECKIEPLDKDGDGIPCEELCE